MALTAIRSARRMPAQSGILRGQTAPDDWGFNIADGIRTVIANGSKGAFYPAVASWITLFTLIEQIDLRLAKSSPGAAKLQKFRTLMADLEAEGVRLLLLASAEDPEFETGTGISHAAFAACVRKLDNDLKADALKLTDRKAAAILKNALAR